MPNIPINMTITTPQYSEDQNKVVITIMDDDSNSLIAKITMDAAEFVMCLGNKYAKGTAIVPEDMSKIGTKMETDRISFVMPNADYDNRKKEAAKEAKRHCPKGWIVCDSFDSQNSFVPNGNNTTTVTCIIRRWLKKK